MSQREELIRQLLQTVEPNIDREGFLETPKRVTRLMDICSVVMVRTRQFDDDFDDENMMK